MRAKGPANAGPFVFQADSDERTGRVECQSTIARSAGFSRSEEQSTNSRLYRRAFHVPGVDQPVRRNPLGRVDRWSTIARSAGFSRSGLDEGQSTNSRLYPAGRFTCRESTNRFDGIRLVESTVGRLSRAARDFLDLDEGQSTNSRLYPAGRFTCGKISGQLRFLRQQAMEALQNVRIDQATRLLVDDAQSRLVFHRGTVGTHAGHRVIGIRNGDDA